MAFFEERPTFVMFKDFFDTFFCVYHGLVEVFCILDCMGFFVYNLFQVIGIPISGKMWFHEHTESFEGFIFAVDHVVVSPYGLTVVLMNESFPREGIMDHLCFRSLTYDIAFIVFAASFAFSSVILIAILIF